MIRKKASYTTGTAAAAASTSATTATRNKVCCGMKNPMAMVQVVFSKGHRETIQLW
jgi:cobalamin biosynthesis protein CbiD